MEVDYDKVCEAVNDWYNKGETFLRNLSEEEAGEVERLVLFNFNKTPRIPNSAWSSEFTRGY